MWFAGVHSDVGGGYAETGLSDIALLWMAERARGYGLTLRPDAFPATAQGPGQTQEILVRPDPMGRLHESRKAFYRLQKPFVRPISTTPAGERVASTAVQHHDRDPGYQPPGLVTYLPANPELVDVEPM